MRMHVLRTCLIQVILECFSSSPSPLHLLIKTSSFLLSDDVSRPREYICNTCFPNFEYLYIAHCISVMNALACLLIRVSERVRIFLFSFIIQPCRKRYIVGLSNGVNYLSNGEIMIRALYQCNSQKIDCLGI